MVRSICGSIIGEKDRCNRITPQQTKSRRLMPGTMPTQHVVNEAEILNHERLRVKQTFSKKIGIVG